MNKLALVFGFTLLVTFIIGWNILSTRIQIARDEIESTKDFVAKINDLTQNRVMVDECKENGGQVAQVIKSSGDVSQKIEFVCRKGTQTYKIYTYDDGTYYWGYTEHAVGIQ